MIPRLPSDLEWHHRPGRHVERYAYDEDGARLYVIFAGGYSGYYSHVPPAMFGSFRAAESKGEFVNERLKGNVSYPWTYIDKPSASTSSSESKARFKCRICGAIRTLPEYDGVMPEHPRKGGTKTLSIECSGSGTYGVQQPPARR